MQEPRPALQAHLCPLQLQPHLPHGAGRWDPDPAPDGLAHHAGDGRSATAAAAAATTTAEQQLAVITVISAAAAAAGGAEGQVHVSAVVRKAAIQTPLSPNATPEVNQSQ